jgi:hypothetical protein
MIHETSQAKIQVQLLRRNISVLVGSGGNIAVLTGKDSKLLIDSGFSVTRVRIEAALNNLSSEPITQLINTHWHVDHTDGKDWVHSAGAKITPRKYEEASFDCDSRGRMGLYVSAVTRRSTSHDDIQRRIPRSSQRYEYCPEVLRRCYEHAISEFIGWYCSEPRLRFSKAVVTRYRMHLESRGLAPGTVNLRRAAIGRLAYEAANAGLLSPEQAAGIRRVKGAKKLGVRVGNWLLAKEACALWELPDSKTLKGKRDRTILSLLLACGLRRGELAELELDDIQLREDHWAIVDLTGKDGHVRTVPVPDWVTRTICEWVTAAGISSGKLFRCVCRAGKTWGDFMTDRVV